MVFNGKNKSCIFASKLTETNALTACLLVKSAQTMRRMIDKIQIIVTTKLHIFVTNLTLSTSNFTTSENRNYYQVTASYQRAYVMRTTVTFFRFELLLFNACALIFYKCLIIRCHNMIPNVS